MATGQQIANWRARQKRESVRHLDQLCQSLGASRVFRSKYRGKCAGCEGTGVIKQGDECVMMDGAIYHLECAFRYRERQRPCESCGSTGALRQGGPVSDKRVCVECAIAEVSG